MDVVFAYLLGDIDFIQLLSGFDPAQFFGAIGFAQFINSIDPAQFFGGLDVASLLAFFDSDEGDAGWLILLLVLAGPAFFVYNYLRYRNSDQRHYHEKETPVAMNNLRQYDNFVEHKTRQKDGTISGANSEKVYGSLVKQGGADRAAKMLTSVMPDAVAKKINRQ